MENAYKFIYLLACEALIKKLELRPHSYVAQEQL